MAEATYWVKRGRHYKLPDEKQTKKMKALNAEHFSIDPEDARQEFFEKYLRQVLTKYNADPLIKAKYMEYATKAKEIPLGKEFLSRMETDIKSRQITRATTMTCN